MRRFHFFYGAYQPRAEFMLQAWTSRPQKSNMGLEKINAAAARNAEQNL
jgi:hypothetical protein